MKKINKEIIFDILIVIVVVLLYIFAAMFLYTNFRERKRKEIANNIIDKIDKKIAENSSIVSNDEITYDTKYDNNKYTILGKIKIPKINIYQPILKENTMDSYNVSVVKISGPPLNTYGNVNIGAHNFMKGNFFIKITKLTNDDVVEITDMSGTTVNYYVYEYNKVPINEASYLRQPEDKSSKIVTLVTCTKGGKERYYVKYFNNFFSSFWCYYNLPWFNIFIDFNYVIICVHSIYI